jgi:hypothetical protein
MNDKRRVKNEKWVAGYKFCLARASIRLSRAFPKVSRAFSEVSRPFPEVSGAFREVPGPFCGVSGLSKPAHASACDSLAFNLSPQKEKHVIAMISPKAKKKQSLLYSTHILI